MTSQSLTLEMALIMYGSHECSDPRDHIYALLGISKSPEFPVDYAKPLAHLYWEVLAHICKDKDCAQLLRGTAEGLQEKMGLSDEEVWRRWVELVRENSFQDLWGYQFIEAMRMIIGELTTVPPQRVSSGVLSGLPAFHVEYAEIAKHNSKTVGKKSITALYELFNHAASTHPSTLSTPLEVATYGPELGDYFIGNVIDASPLSTSEHETERQLYTDGSLLISFTLSQNSSVLRYSCSSMIDHGRRSEMKHLLLASHADSQPGRLLPLAKADIVCMFSGYQAALVIRRLPGDKLLCGFAVVEFKSSSWFGRAVAQISGPNVGKQSACSLHIFMRPHSIVTIEDWRVEVGRPWRGPFLEHCQCKPGEGGCV